MATTKVAKWFTDTVAFPSLTLPACDLTMREAEGRTEVFDLVRKRYVALTPEEWVRQHVIHALHRQTGYPLELMQVEGAITLNGMTRRCDIVVYSRSVKPVMIVECKKPEVSLSQKVIDQICRYNLVLKVPYLYVTNGMQHIVCRVKSDGLEQMPCLPSWEDLERS